jgi:cation:H+ antiporter
MVGSSVLPKSPLVAVGVVIVTTSIIWVGSGWLESAAEGLSTHYGLPAVIQGSIVVAVGSSFPELASVVFTAIAGTFDIGVGAIVGSAIFNILVIPAVSGLATEGTLDTNRAIVYKEAQFYMIAVSGLVITFALAVIYFPLPDGPPFTGRLTRLLVLIPLLLYGLYLFIQWKDATEHAADEPADVGSVPAEWGRLLVSLVVILVAVEQLVRAVEKLSTTFGIPEFFAGIIIIAAATSLPDTLVSVRAARANKGLVSIGNIFGSNTFDLLVAIPIGVLIVGSAPVNFAVAVPIFGILTLATVILFVFLRTGFTITTVESYALLVAYSTFITWIVSEIMGVTNVIKGV